jgi:hypothetical protein
MFSGISTSTMNNIHNTQTNYSSALTNTSATYSRDGYSRNYYYEAIQINVSTTGNYTIKSNSAIDTYGYLYENNVTASNILAFNDDSDDTVQFTITYTLQAGRTYIVIFTTYDPGVTGSFSLIVSGPARVSLVRINLNLTLPYSSTTSRPSSK